MGSPTFPRTDATTLRRAPDRGSYDRAEAYAILDEAIVAHVGIAVDGQPIDIPMHFGRDEDRLYLHGGVASRLVRHLDGGARVCVTVTLLDGLVFARSARMHSANYRSVVVLGVATRLTDPAAVDRALACVVDHMAPGRSAEARGPNDADRRTTTVLEVPIETASMKRRVGGPVAEPDEAPAWTGELPLRVTAGAPVPTPDASSAGLPGSLSPWCRPGLAAGPS
jgi:hypothetical protein